VAEGRWVEVGDGVLARRHAELNLTTGLVLGAERALVVDTRGDARQGAELAAAVRAVTALPPVVVVTHAHFDHCFGTAAFLPCPVFAHPRCRAALAAGTGDQRAEWSAYYRERDDHLTAEALAATEPPLPDHSVDPSRSLDLGARVVTLRHLGRGHTDHDVVVHVPDAAIVFAGDLVEEGAPPDVGDDAVVGEWPGTLDALLALRPAVVVPGHGEPVDRAFVAVQRAELAELAVLHAAVAAGRIDAATAARRSPYPDPHWAAGSRPRPSGSPWPKAP
jgi:glyoxylase-like metal-dependent hydrolase (beta-lactamase superfamily II)